MKNKKILIILSLVLLLIIAVLLYFWYQRKLSLPTLSQISSPVTNLFKKQQPTPSEEVKQINFGKEGQIIATATRSVVKKELNKDDLMRLAASFAERFGSYSNQSNHRNIYDSEIYMSERMLAWASSYLAQPTATSSISDAYYGITTKAVTKEVKDFDDSAGLASILVRTRRQEASGTTGNVSRTFSQSIVIKLVKENNSWKVDSATWQNK
jgi:hypothetical protein